MKNSISFIVDPQIQFSNPSSRIDNYFENIMHKFEQAIMANKYNIILGDLTEFPVLDIEGLMEVIRVLSEHKKLGGETYSLVGNHDIYNWNRNTLKKTTLGLLSKLDLIKIIDSSEEVENSIKKIKIEDWIIRCTDLKNPRENIPSPKSDNEILIGHNYYEFNKDPKHSLYYDDLRDLKYKYIFLGHDHENYDNKLIESGATLFRPGNLSRGAAHDYNFKRKVGYNQLDLDTGKVKFVEVDYLPAEEVFSYEVVEKQNDNTPKYVYDLEDLMKNFKNKSKVKISIKKMMEDNPEIPDEIVDFIGEVHELCGLEFV